MDNVYIMHVIDLEFHKCVKLFQLPNQFARSNKCLRINWYSNIAITNFTPLIISSHVLSSSRSSLNVIQDHLLFWLTSFYLYFINLYFINCRPINFKSLFDIYPLPSKIIVLRTSFSWHRLRKCTFNIWKSKMDLWTP